MLLLTGSNYSSYDTTAYTTASASYYQASQPPPVQPQQPPPQPQPPPTQQPKPLGGAALWSGPSGSGPTNAASSSSYSKKPAFPNKPLKLKGLLKQPQLHYCEICKISCAGPQVSQSKQGLPVVLCRALLPPPSAEDLNDPPNTKIDPIRVKSHGHGLLW